MMSTNHDSSNQIQKCQEALAHEWIALQLPIDAHLANIISETATLDEVYLEVRNLFLGTADERDHDLAPVEAPIEEQRRAIGCDRHHYLVSFSNAYTKVQSKII